MQEPALVIAGVALAPFSLRGALGLHWCRAGDRVLAAGVLFQAPTCPLVARELCEILYGWLQACHN